jgi:maltooligosyltrehalose trehalohydrolase
MTTTMPITTPSTASRLGARWLGDGRTAFEVWAPAAARVELVLDATARRDEPTRIEMERAPRGYHRVVAPDVRPGDTYRFRLHREDGTFVDRADPASRFQPEGVQGPSAVDDPDGFVWTDRGFSARPLHEQVLYELHVGTFSPQGTFDGAVEQLPHLVELGITTIELLPVWQFPGGRNWGYDGVLQYAVQDTYGGPEGLRRLVDAAHDVGIAVVLDVVYNHIGPEGNPLADFGPYFTDLHATPWGDGLNADGPGSDEVRRYIIEHGVSFVRDLHLDGFRLDAVHGIIDQSAVHLLEAFATAVHAQGERMGKAVHLIAESDLCDPRLLRSPEVGGYGLDAQWADEFHHAIHVALTGEQDGYYADHAGLADLVPQLRDRFLHAGRYSAYRQRTVGRPARDLPYDRFVACVQNHDQVGNRMMGHRLSELVDLEGLKLAAAALLTGPFVPMLFMGEEHADPAPFPYFVSHTDPDLVKAVQDGRAAEFADFAWQGETPDPQAQETFASARIDVSLARNGGMHAALFALYRELIATRAEVPMLHRPDAPDPDTVLVAGHEAIALHRRDGDDAVVVAVNADPQPVEVVVPAAAGPWEVRLATADERFDGPGRAGEPTEDGDVLRIEVAPRSVVLLVRRSDADREVAA